MASFTVVLFAKVLSVYRYPELKEFILTHIVDEQMMWIMIGWFHHLGLHCSRS